MYTWVFLSNNINFKHQPFVVSCYLPLYGEKEERKKEKNEKKEERKKKKAGKEGEKGRGKKKKKE